MKHPSGTSVEVQALHHEEWDERHEKTVETGILADDGWDGFKRRDQLTGLSAAQNTKF
jgi:hypothetical protein